MNVRMILSVLFLVMGCSSWVAAQTVRGNSLAGQVVYEKNCLRCHGEKLDGNGSEGQYLIVRPTYLQSITSRANKGYRLLQGYRGHPAADVEAIEEVLLRLFRLVEEIHEISELDLNPIFVLPEGQGCRIVDARIRLEKSALAV